MLLTPTSAFLLPRFPECTEGVGFEADVLTALAGFELAFVPRLIGRHEIPEAWPFPFLEIERMPGAPIATDGTEPDDECTTDLLCSVGHAIGTLHALPTATLPEPMDQEHLLHHFVDDGFARCAVARLGSVTSLPAGTADRWASAFAPLAQMGPVFVHGELGDPQLLHDAGTVTAILDWDTAGVGPPLVDLGFFEWAPWLHRRQHRFNDYRRSLWYGYAAGRDERLLELSEAFITLSAVRDVLWHLDHPEPPPWVDLGTLDAAVDMLQDADRLLR